MAIGSPSASSSAPPGTADAALVHFAPEEAFRDRRHANLDVEIAAAERALAGAHAFVPTPYQ